MRARFLAAFVALAFTFGLLGPAPAGAITGHPTPANVGIPAGTTTTAYAGPHTITSCGTVIDHKNLVGYDLTIRAGNGHDDEAHPCVTITNSIIYGGIIDDGYTGLGYGPLVMSDSTVINLTTRDVACVSDTRLYMHRDYVSGCRSGVQSDGYTAIFDSYLEANREYCARLHGGTADCQHLDAYITNGNYGTPLFFQNDTFLCDATLGDPVEVGAGCAADVGLFADFSIMSNISFWGNYFLATDYANFCISGPLLPPPKIPGSHDVNFVGNDFQRNTNAECGKLGNIINGWANSAGMQCGNTFTDNGANAFPAAPNC